MNLLIVGIGGFAGSIFRYLLSLIPVKTAFPVMTFITNVVGAILIGFIVETISQKGLSEEATLLLKTGFCGGFTTFSTFSLETFQFIQDKSYFIACSYIVLSILCCLLGVWFGFRIYQFFN